MTVFLCIMSFLCLLSTEGTKFRVIVHMAAAIGFAALAVFA